MHGQTCCFGNSGGLKEDIAINKVERFTEMKKEYTRIFAFVYGVKPFMLFGLECFHKSVCYRILSVERQIIDR